LSFFVKPTYIFTNSIFYDILIFALETQSVLRAIISLELQALFGSTQAIFVIHETMKPPIFANLKTKRLTVIIMFVKSAGGGGTGLKEKPKKFKNH